jgi:hypothetical protein
MSCPCCIFLFKDWLGRCHFSLLSPSSETLVIKNFSDDSVVRVIASSSFLFRLSVSILLGIKHWLGAVRVAFSFHLHRPYFLDNIATSRGFLTKRWHPYVGCTKASLLVYVGCTKASLLVCVRHAATAVVIDFAFKLEGRNVPCTGAAIVHDGSWIP